MCVSHKRVKDYAVGYRSMYIFIFLIWECAEVLWLNSINALIFVLLILSLPLASKEMKTKCVNPLFHMQVCGMFTDKSSESPVVINILSGDVCS